MIKVFQTKENNCYQACLASLLECQIDIIPEYFGNDYSEWSEYFDYLNLWIIQNYGLYLFSITTQPFNPLMEKPMDDPFYNNPVIGCGDFSKDGKSNIKHAVIFQKGYVVHDPLIGTKGIEHIEEFDVLAKVFSESRKEESNES